MVARTAGWSSASFRQLPLRLSSPTLLTPEVGKDLEKVVLTLWTVNRNHWSIPLCVKNKLSIASWNVRTLLDLAKIPDRPHHRTALVALELARHNIDIAALRDQTTWRGLPDRGWCWSKLLQHIPESPIGINERLMIWRIPLAKERFATLISAYAPTLDSLTIQDVLTTCVMRGAECWTDHLMVRSKLLMSIQPRGPWTAANKKLNCTALNSLTTKDNLRRLLAENLKKIPEESADWTALRQAIHSAASDKKTSPGLSLLKTTHEAHKALLSCPGSPTLKTTFTTARTATQRALRTMEDTWWVQKAQEIQNLADCNNTQGFYDAIKALYGPRKRAFAPVRSADRSTVFKDRQEILAPFIDLSKAFDTINRELLWKHLSKLGVPPKFLSILQQLHDGMQARVLAGELQSQFFEVKVGVKQGCVLAPVLFNIILSAITCLFHRVMGHEDGVHVEYRLDRSLFNIRRLQARTRTKTRQI
ncbi:LINE-1 retrotransposable element ORF2 protein [Merluccius polli]|uniref:LINE-1 retrotransposable element ORF2 protein n=1 Tax=Merluccius polli TaxID=89951 RepID=A0AA47N4E5_MERPO|nr:LINE-1 retrotransposable element ORF2 protein [Merluccius polli]